MRDNRGLTEAMEGSALKWLGKFRKMALQNCKIKFYMEFGFNWLKGGSRRGLIWYLLLGGACRAKFRGRGAA